MKRLLCPRLPSPGKMVRLPEAEANHATRVLRLREGDQVEAIDGHGGAVVAKLRLISGDPHLEFVESAASVELRNAAVAFPVTLELSVLKGDSMEWAVEKAVELGISELVPLISERTVVQMDRKGPEAFRERWQKIADQALKQCGRLEALRIQTPIALDELLRNAPATEESPRLWLDEADRESGGSLLSFLNAQSGSLGSARLLIGPEGGWSDDERLLLQREPSCVRLSLGPLVLRAETAALCAASVVTAWARAAKIHS